MGTPTGQTPSPATTCIYADGNVYIINIITVTTTTTVTNTNISAPILTASGSITWVSGIPVPAKGKSPTPKSGGKPKTANAAGGWIKCTATSHSTVQKASGVRCPVIPPGSTSSNRRRPRLLCEPAAQPAGHQQPVRRKRISHFVVYCRGI